MKIAIIYLLAIVGAEAVTIFIQPLAGMVFHIGILVAAILQSSLSVALPHNHRQLVLSLALVPLVRIISLSMPLTGIPQKWWYLIIYTPLIVAAIVAMRVLDYKVRDIGLTFKFSPFQLAIAATGVGFGFVEYLILKPQALVAELSAQEVWLPALIFLLFVGFGEELIFRGVLQRTAGDAFGRWGIVYIGFIFAILHMGFLSWVDVILVFAVALFFGWAVKKTGSLVGVTLSHGITNILLYLVVPFFF
jgi:hypothetical protein